MIFGNGILAADGIISADLFADKNPPRGTTRLCDKGRRRKMNDEKNGKSDFGGYNDFRSNRNFLLTKSNISV